jgi:hypothetical protein
LGLVCVVKTDGERERKQGTAVISGQLPYADAIRVEGNSLDYSCKGAGQPAREAAGSSDLGLMISCRPVRRALARFFGTEGSVWHATALNP